MTKNMHSQKRTYTSAYNGYDKKGGFRNPEAPSFSPEFVDSHEQETDYIDYNRVTNEKSLYRHVSHIIRVLLIC